MWNIGPPKTSEDRWAEVCDDYPFIISTGAEGPNPKLVAGNMSLDLIYIKRGDTKIYGFRTEEDAARFKKRYGTR